jgi:hypothetical protein
VIDRALRRRHNKRQQPPPGELAVYDGQDHVGTIRRRDDGRFIALDGRGRELGRYETLRDAMHAIPAAAEIGSAS